MGVLVKPQLRTGYRSFLHSVFGGTGEGVIRERKVREHPRRKEYHPFSGFRPLSKLPAQKQPRRAGNRSPQRKKDMNQPSSSTR